MRRIGGIALAVVFVGALVVAAATISAGSGTEIAHDGDRLTLEAGPDERVSGQTDRDPGTTLRVRVASADATRPFLLTSNATVDDDGSFAATFDLRDAANASANVTVLHDGDELASVPAEIEPCEDCEPVTDGSDGSNESDDSADAAETVVDSDGDVLALEADAGQEVTGESHLEAGTELLIRVESDTATNPFLLQETATVSDDGTFGATVDLNRVEPGSNATLAVVHDGTELADVDVVVEPCESDCETPAAGDAGESAGFGLTEPVFAASGDETAEIGVSLGDADAATLTVGGDDAGYHVTATAEDGNDDGRVGFVLDPAAAGDESATVTVADEDDSVAVLEESEIDGALDAGEYDLSVYRGSSADGDPDEVGTLLLRDE